jgi:sugar lactone lactonase YvrE
LPTSPLLAQFDLPSGLAVSQTGDLFVADTHNCRVRHVSPSGTVTTVAGDGVPAVPTDAAQFADRRPALQARFERPSGVAVDETGMVWVTDDAHLRMYHPRSNMVFTACSDQRVHQQPVKFTSAAGIAISGGKIFVVDSGKIMLLTPHED